MLSLRKLYPALGIAFLGGACAQLIGVDDFSGADSTSSTGSGASVSHGGAGGDAAGSAGDGGTGLDGLGEPCDGPRACVQGVCVDGVCCSGRCQGPCRGCNLEGSIGACTPFASHDPDPDHCGEGVCDGAGNCANGTLAWNGQFGQDGSTVAIVRILDDSQGNLFVLGTCQGTVVIGNEIACDDFFSEPFIAKLSPIGMPLWAKSFSAQGETVAKDMALTADDGIVIAVNSTAALDFGGGSKPYVGGSIDGHVAKFDNDGEFEWEFTPAGTGGDEVYSIAVSSDGSVVAGGFFSGSINVGSKSYTSAETGTTDIFLIKLLADGQPDWTLTFGSLQSQFLEAIAIDDSDNIYASGEFFGSFSFGGTTVLEAGSYPAYEMFLAKFDSSGNHVWSQEFGSGGDFSFPRALVVDRLGRVVMAGSFSNTADFGGGELGAKATDAFVAAFDQDGNHLRSADYGGQGDQVILELASDNHGNLLAVGQFTGTLDFGGGEMDGNAEGFVVKFDSAGVELWHHELVGPNQQDAFGIDATNADHALVAGQFGTSVTLSSGVTLGTIGVADGLLVDYSP